MRRMSQPLSHFLWDQVMRRQYQIGTWAITPSLSRRFIGMMLAYLEVPPIKIPFPWWQLYGRLRVTRAYLRLLIRFGEGRPSAHRFACALHLRAKRAVK